ncbi:hypothetical protein BO86DRAFT_95146 [Aspergillus japonicus CBS 114.51]|uniref:Uncharacterized protein n=1 Tax=Aspergillus japonicus CBS 114.51 TaxID=1448312 RepID=A0A8T8X0B3_ASPJA|nr:hypothetical protein BO86DRAFT_95146 [Aspergillus japonicus CBS 114.51]RAH81586.1 hypothetical protein BO86DRAFT_95146 [Aspergillus japonicus CBS 114.51]
MSIYLAGTNNLTHGLALMTIIGLIRDLGSFSMGYGIVPFVERCGFLTSFGFYAGLHGFVGLGAVLLYVFSDKLRASRWSGSDV